MDEKNQNIEYQEVEMSTESALPEIQSEPVETQNNWQSLTPKARATLIVLFYALNLVFYQSLAKMLTNEMNVNPVDLSLCCRIITFTIAIIVICRYKFSPTNMTR